MRRCQLNFPGYKIGVRSNVSPGEVVLPSASARRGRTRKSSRRRDAIIHAAINVINEKSFALATMSDIAASLDLRDGALYYYFESKQALAYACHVHSLGVFDRILRDVDERDGTGFAKLEGFIRGMIEDGERNGPQLYFGDYSYLNSDERAHVKSWSDRLIGMLQGFLEQGVRDGSVVPCEPKIVVQLVIGMLIWLAKWVPTIQDISVSRLLAAIKVASLNGIGKPE